MKLRHAAAFALLSTLFVGCAVEGRSYERAAVAPAKSAVYVYRPYNVFGSVVEDPVSCGDQSTRFCLSRIPRGSYRSQSLDGPSRLVQRAFLNS
jgi:hypothetical protein